LPKNTWKETIYTKKEIIKALKEDNKQLLKSNLRNQAIISRYEKLEETLNERVEELEERLEESRRKGGSLVGNATQGLRYNLSSGVRK
jgi:benzoyl-CoA reductase/2-hydroxyglutaryl-CoA dehydratase subunit BcrC/BadD/HgdB